MAAAILLTPVRWRRVKLGAQFRRPVFVEGFEFDNRSGADVTDGQANAASLCIAKIGFGFLALLDEFFGGRQALVTEGAEARHVKDVRATGGGGFGLATDGAEMVESVAGDADLKPRRRASQSGNRRTKA